MEGVLPRRVDHRGDRGRCLVAPRQVRSRSLGRRNRVDSPVRRVGGDVVHRDPRRQPSSQTTVSAARSTDALREGQVQRDRTLDPLFPRPTHVFLDDCGIDRATENGAPVTGLELDRVDGQTRSQIHFADGCARDDPDSGPAEHCDRRPCRRSPLRVVSPQRQLVGRDRRSGRRRWLRTGAQRGDA